MRPELGIILSEPRLPYASGLSFLLLKKMYLFLAALGLGYCARAFSSGSELGLLFIAKDRLIAVASLAAELWI